MTQPIVVLSFIILLKLQWSCASETTASHVNVFTLFQNVSNLPGPRMSFNRSLPDGVFEFEFKTSVQTALVLYQDSDSSYIELYLEGGKLHLSFLFGEDNVEGVLITEKLFDDFEWHSVRIEQKASTIDITLDKNITQTFQTQGLPVFSSELQLGGFTPERSNNPNNIASVHAYLMDKHGGWGITSETRYFNACVRNIKYGRIRNSTYPIDDVASNRLHVKEGCSLTYCDRPNPVCKNGGICLLNATVRCDCKRTGYEGKYCDVDIDECALSASTCVQNTSCINTPGSYTCQCPTGYTGDGKYNCTDIDECALSASTCVQNTSCINTPGSYTCQCPTGYTGDGKYNCTDIDECIENENVCHKHSECINSGGSYTCQCASGFTGDGKENCTEINNFTESGNVCGHNVSCLMINGSQPCQCGKNFTTHGRDNSIDINECAEFGSDCHQNASCVENNGSYSCQCTKGLTGDGKVNCTDINECLSRHVCHKHADCLNVEGSFSCQCKPGYFGDGKHNCSVNHCDQLPCFPGLGCTPTSTGFTCEKCPKLFHGNGRNCRLGKKTEPQLYKSSITINDIWNDDLLNKSSTAFRKYSDRIIKEIRKAYSSHVQFSYVIITKFRRGSVIAEFELIFTKHVENPLEPLRRSLNETKFGKIIESTNIKLDTKKSSDKEKILGLEKPIFISIVVAAALVFIVLGVVMIICIARRGTRKRANISGEKMEREICDGANGFPLQKLIKETDGGSEEG